MARRTDAELGRIVRKAIQGMRIKPRRLFGPLCFQRDYNPAKDMFLESDADFFENNAEVAVALLEALAPPSRRKKRPGEE